MYCYFVSDLHGNRNKYQKLFQKILFEKPDMVFFGGDLLPNMQLNDVFDDFFNYLHDNFLIIKERTETHLILILGNDDPRKFERIILDWDKQKIINYVHFRNISIEDLFITGYSYVPPSPFLLKDWEKFDVSRYVSPGCISPFEGFRTIDVPVNEPNTNDIAEDLEIISKFSKPNRTIYLFHSPPYDTDLDRVVDDGKQIDFVPLDLHIGSIAIKRFITKKMPLITLHGHAHESAHITGRWHEKLKDSHLFSAAHNGPELALIKFDTNDLLNANRELI